MSNTKKRTVLTAILLVGLTMRPGLTGIGSLLKLIKPDMGLNSTQAGLLTTIPLIAFALFSPFTWKINEKLGTRNTIVLSFISIIFGIVIRSYAGYAGLFIGTVFIGIGIAFGNVIMPAVIKNEFPENFGTVTALNSCALGVASGIASGVNTPLANAGLGWKGALCVWAGIACIGVAAWMLGGKNVKLNIKGSTGLDKELLHNKVAWSVTLFLGLVTLLFYSCTCWLATIFQSKGYDMKTSGLYVSAFQLIGFIPSFFVPMLAGKSRDQRKVTFATITFALVGLIIMIFTDNSVLLLIAALLAGIGCNGLFALSMAFIGFRAKNGKDSGRLSSMSQSIGYILAAFGPLGMGWINTIAGDWTINLWIMVVITLLLYAVASVCARESTI